MSDSPQTAIGNRQIAQFMRGEIVPETWTWHYHEDWNQIIPVVEKIKGLIYKDKGKLKFDKVLGPCYSGMKEALLDLDIFALWCGVVAFIHWHNKK